MKSCTVLSKVNRNCKQVLKAGIVNGTVKKICSQMLRRAGLAGSNDVCMLTLNEIASLSCAREREREKFLQALASQQG